MSKLGTHGKVEFWRANIEDIMARTAERAERLGTLVNANHLQIEQAKRMQKILRELKGLIDNMSLESLNGVGLQSLNVKILEANAVLALLKDLEKKEVA